MTGWSIDLRPRPEPRDVGGGAAGRGTVIFFACYGLVVWLGSLFVR